MVLFTSHAALRAARQTLIDTVEGAGIPVLAQGVDGPPHRVMRRFVENPGGILLGTSSFWEGVDLPTGVLKALVLARLPFNVPSDPIFAARSEMYEDSFNGYAVPQAVLRFRQGFGRLIRGGRDRGAIVIMDSRLLTKGYGPAFLDSLPQCHYKAMPMASIPGEVSRWLETPL
jgi:DNA polymerase-3 subunit epsilon/ATP-dependent DNA helicase DinG